MNFLIKVITVKKKLTKKFIVLSPSIFSSLFVKNNKHNHLTLKIVIKKKKKPISQCGGIFFIINKNITSGDCGRIKKDLLPCSIFSHCYLQGLKNHQRYVSTIGTPFRICNFIYSVYFRQNYQNHINFTIYRRKKVTLLVFDQGQITLPIF